MSKPQALVERRKTLLIGLALFAVTFAIYWPTIGYEFVVVDDNQYVYENPRVSDGLSASGLSWAFQNTYAANWHPLTWISHMIDSSIHGLFAGGHHLTNVLLHSINTLLLFLLLKKLTKELWPSAMVAALFGWHPLHVESVAWVAERKDVLSTFFLILTIGTYARYVERPSPGRYLPALVFFALGLMAKSMLVTLPCLLLLLDYWPLKRFKTVPEVPESPRTTTTTRNLFLEKIPFFALSVLAGVITVVAQRAGGALKTFQAVPLESRLLNAATAYGVYLWKMIWPVDLCVFYPLPATLPWIRVISSVALILAITGGAYWKRRSYPWFIVGWLWFLGALVPVIGIVQIGSQALADRYTYIPSIGLFIAVVWTAARLTTQRFGSILPRVAAVTVLLLCAGATRHQLGYWQNSITLFTHALAVTGSNAFSENNMGVALSNAGKSAEAIPHYEIAVRLKPNDLKARYNLGVELVAAGKLDEAVFHFSEALRLDPTSEILHNNLGVVLAQQSKWDLAMDHFNQSIQLNPVYPKPYLNRAMILQREGLASTAITNYTQALALQPDWPEALNKLAWLLATCPETEGRNPMEAIRLSQRVNQISHEQAPACLNTLAVAYSAAGQFSNAAVTAQKALQKAEAVQLDSLAGVIRKNLAAYREGQNPSNNWKNPGGP